MSFMLVILPLLDRGWQDPRHGSFYAMGDLQTLDKAEGVFAIDPTAWIFDTKLALGRYAKVIHSAHQNQIQLHVFPLDAETVLAHGASVQKSEKLEAFLSSYLPKGK